MNQKSKPVVRVTRRFNASAERVFDAWLDPVRAAKWLFATDQGKMLRAEIDPRVGGKWNFTERRGDTTAEHTGEYLVIDRPRRLVFTFGVPSASPDFDRVTVEIEPQGSGCVLTLTQEMKPEWAEYRDRTEGGWTKIIDGLGRSLGEPRFNELPGRFTAPAEIRLERILPGPIKRVWAYLTEPEKRRKWFAGGPMELRPGGRASLRFFHADLPGENNPPPKYQKFKDPVDVDFRITRSEPPRLLGIVFGSDPADSEATFELSPAGKDVKLTVVHRRLADFEEKISVAAGWHAHLAILVAELEGSAPPPFWSTHTRLEAEYARELTATANT